MLSKFLKRSKQDKKVKLAYVVMDKLVIHARRKEENQKGEPFDTEL